jgi:hypothetical protein
MKYIITEAQFSTIQTNNPDSIIKMVKKIYNSMDMEGVCELDIGYDEEDNNFHCYLIIDKDWYTKNPIEKDLKNVKIRKYAKELKEKINNYLGIYMFVGHYVNPLSCES